MLPKFNNVGIATFLLQLRIEKIILPVLELKFNKTRKWRFDLAWPNLKVAVEVDGGVYTHGRHVRPQGFLNDCEKINHALLDGWRVFRFSPQQIKSGYALNFMLPILKSDII